MHGFSLTKLILFFSSILTVFSAPATSNFTAKVELLMFSDTKTKKKAVAKYAPRSMLCMRIIANDCDEL